MAILQHNALIVLRRMETRRNSFRCLPALGLHLNHCQQGYEDSAQGAA
jgi:hypothetical protein